MIELNNVHKEYSGNVHALRDVSLKINDNEFVFVTGESGAGKSTLIKLITKEIEPTSGEIRVNGKDIRKIKGRRIPIYRRQIGCIFQDFRLLNDRNVYENVAFAERIVNTPQKKINKKVPQMLAMVGLSSKASVMPMKLSGGERQRVAIARALINNPKILIADEPTGNLDDFNSWEIMKILEDINRAGTTVVVVTHNMDFISLMHKRVVTLKYGTVYEDGEEA